MFFSGGPDRRIKDPFLGRLYYYLFMIPFFTLASATMVYGIFYPIFTNGHALIFVSVIAFRIYCHLYFGSKEFCKLFFICEINPIYDYRSYLGIIQLTELS